MNANFQRFNSTLDSGVKAVAKNKLGFYVAIMCIFQFISLFIFEGSRAKARSKKKNKAAEKAKTVLLWYSLVTELFIYLSYAIDGLSFNSPLKIMMVYVFALNILQITIYSIMVKTYGSDSIKVALGVRIGIPIIIAFDAFLNSKKSV